MTWKKLTENNCREWKSSSQSTPKKAVSHLPGRVITDMDDVLAPAC